MRKIKFRAYDKVRKEYLSAGQIYLQINPGKNPADCVQYLDILQGPNAYAVRFVIEQFTGLIDKNGKEIWEGDIVKYIDCNDTISTKEVRYADGGFTPVCEIAWMADIEGCECVVIGNRFDNPEMLKGGEE